MGKDRSMAIKHAKAKKEAMKEVMNNQNDFAQTSWGLSAISCGLNNCFSSSSQEEPLGFIFALLIILTPCSLPTWVLCG